MAEAALDAAVADFLAAGPAEEEVARAKAWVAGALAAPADRLTVAREWGTALATGLTVEDVQAWPGIVAAVTAEDVARVAREVLRREASVTGRLVPDGKAGR